VSVRIALVGDRHPDHPSHRELDALRGMLGDDVSAEWVASDGERVRALEEFDGVWVVPGSPYADDDAVYAAVRWARENDVPFLGTCGGLQYAVVEYFRNALGLRDASHAETDGTGAGNVVHALACSLQGEERLVRPIPGTRFSRLVNDEPFVGMHYCGFGPGPAEVQRLVEDGMVLQAIADDAGAEVIELPTNRFFVLTLFQPHIGALAGKPLHPLLGEFVRCARVHGGAPRRAAQSGSPGCAEPSSPASAASDPAAARRLATSSAGRRMS
jgi:CTP synthase (UTP-ammonia lyase)